MCGLFGSLGNALKFPQFNETFNELTHRGPDDTRVIQPNGEVTLGFHRLAIMDTMVKVFNAEQVERAGGGWMVLEKNLSVEALKLTLQNLLESPETLQKAAAAAKNQGRIDAAHRLADHIAEFH